MITRSWIKKFHLNSMQSDSKKGNTELKDKVQKTLDEMAEDGTVDKIAEKYADYGVPGALCIGKNR